MDMEEHARTLLFSMLIKRRAHKRFWFWVLINKAYQALILQNSHNKLGGAYFCAKSAANLTGQPWGKAVRMPNGQPRLVS